MAELLSAAQRNCDEAIKSLSNRNPGVSSSLLSLRSKILFCCANARWFSIQNEWNDDNNDAGETQKLLNAADKDLFEVLCFDSSNMAAALLLQHAGEQHILRKLSSPLAKDLESLCRGSNNHDLDTNKPRRRDWKKLYAVVCEDLPMS